MRETTQPHSRLLKCGLQVEESRAYWERREDGPPRPEEAFESYWFGAKSLPRVQVLLANFRHRFEAFPPAIQTLRNWKEMSASTRQLICHWHLQLSDPLYRHFSGDYLLQRRTEGLLELSRDQALRWVRGKVPTGWVERTKLEYASKLLSAAFAAGLIGSNRDPRPLQFPTVSPHALAYLLHLLRDVHFAGTMLENPYLASVGLQGAELDRRLSALPGLVVRRQGQLVDFDWAHPDLSAWAAHEVAGAANVEAG